MLICVGSVTDRNSDRSQAEVDEPPDNEDPQDLHRDCVTSDLQQLAKTLSVLTGVIRHEKPEDDVHPDDQRLEPLASRGSFYFGHVTLHVECLASCERLASAEGRVARMAELTPDSPRVSPIQPCQRHTWSKALNQG